MRINADTVLGLADLARLSLSADEVERMRRDLEAILDYVEKLSEIDTTDVAATAHVLDISTPFRADRVADLLPVAEAVRNAPQHDDSSMIVPKVIE